MIDNPRKGAVPALLEWTDSLHTLDPGWNGLGHTYIHVAKMLNAVQPARCRTFIDERKRLHAGQSDTDKEVRRQLENYQRLMRNQDAPATDFWRYLRNVEPTLADLTAYKGKVVLVMYLAVDWTSRTMHLEELHRKYHDAGLEIIQVAYHNRSTTAPAVQRDKAAMERYVAGQQWPWRVIWEAASHSDNFYQIWGQGGFPCSVVIGRDGRVVRDIPGETAWEVMLPRELYGRSAKP